MTFARVAVPVPARVGSLFTYHVLPGTEVRVGSLVMVPFGSRVLPAVVVRLDPVPPDIPTRDLLGPVAGAPSLSPERVALAEWMAVRYRAALFDALGLFLPPGWQQSLVQTGGSEGDPARWAFNWPPPALSTDTPVGLASEEGGSAAPSPPARTARGRVVALLREKGLLPAGFAAEEAGCTLATVARMVAEGLLVADAGTGGRGDGGTGGGGDTGIRGHGGGGVAGSEDGRTPPPGYEEPSRPGSASPRPRVSTSPRPPVPPSDIVLNESQAGAFAPMAEALAGRTHAVFLLHGVTGSGKTHVYLRLIEGLAREGRGAIVLVSEIAQTPEALHRYSERFPGRVALVHSALPNAARRNLWREIHLGRFDVVIGPRSALFAPMPDLSLVVLDEEHEPAYKQEERAPCYHARQVAIELGRRLGAVVVLGSATPDVGSYYLARRGVYQLQVLPDRYAGPREVSGEPGGTDETPLAPPGSPEFPSIPPETPRGWSSGRLPAVEVVDLREELRAGNTGILSRSLLTALERVLAAREQAILFLNRRGSSTCVLCRDCGHVVQCRRCDVPLVFHKDAGEMVCHQCNRRSAPPTKCPACKKTRISYFGAGTERVEAEVRRLFPTARVLRWDHDTAARRDAHARLHRQFERHEADVLVGTQMVAKALDFPLVTLVGVVLADVTLHLPDFRAAERTFQLLSQVAGRAGRGSAEGKVIIQTYSPAHYSVLAAARHDYEAFYEQELAFRKFHSYPPFRRLAKLLYAGSGEARARLEALEMLKRLRARVGELGIGDVDLLGPAPAFHSRVRSRYRWQILLAGEGLSRLLEEVPLPVGWSLDVDPVSLL